jgi:hypothetical protein
MTYEPITDDKKQEWIDWLDNQASVLKGKPELKSQNQVFETPEGDVATGKDLVGNLLATLTGNPITID